MPTIDTLIRPDIANLEPYTPIVPPDVLATRLGIAPDQIIKLDANENPYGPAPGVAAALADSAGYACYPDPDHTRLRAALCGYTDQPVERIICGSGADELIDLLLRLVLQPGDVVLDCPPTFGMYSFDTAVCGGRLVEVPRGDDFALDVAAIERAATEHAAKVLFITSPNNPSGNAPPPADIARLLQLPLLVVVDEAYIEFSDHPRGVADMVGGYDNLVVLRTFSKWAGLAGLRIGYGLVPEALATHLWKIKQPYNVNVAAERAALASLAELDYLRSNVQQLTNERERLFAALRQLPMLHVSPSQANFLLCRVVNGDAAALQQRLEQQGVMIRYYRKAGLRDCVRVSVGTPQQNDALLAALQS
jgi:histidinol-phosphate aminotransferase